MSKNYSIFIAATLILISGVIVSDWIYQKNTANRIPPQKISLNILFSHHALATDLSLPLFKNRLSQADIFLMEYPAWDTAWEQDINRVSQGKLSPHEFFSKRQVSEAVIKNTFQFLQLQLNGLYKSGVFATSIDLPANNPLADKINQSASEMNQIQLSDDFDEMLRIERKKYKNFTDLQIQRQQYMVNRFIELTNTIKAGQIPAGKEKPEIKILFLLGSNHIKISDLLKERSINVNKEFSHTPYTYDYHGELTIKFIAGEEVSDELLAFGFFQFELIRLFGSSWVHDEEKSTRLIRNITSRFTPNEIKNIFITMANYKNPDLLFKQMVTELAKQKKVTIPTTKQEFDNFAI